MKIGFIGLGNMGAPMAANLAAAGHDVVGFDTAAGAPDGVGLAKSSAEAVEGADVVITMLPNGAILRAVAAEIIPAMAPVPYWSIVPRSRSPPPERSRNKPRVRAWVGWTRRFLVVSAGPRAAL